MKPVVRIRYVNFFGGFDDEKCRTHVLMDLCDEFTFVFCEVPDILLVGCYGQEPIARSNAVKVGYYTENLPPDLLNFDYFFGCEYSAIIDHPKYRKRVFGPLNPGLFDGCKNPELALRRKTQFCNFIYSNRVPFRERFFRQVSRYRDVRAPGKSMNNCSDLSARTRKDWQEDKLGYLSRFKFTISFENSRRAGYATEKLFDAFSADSVPVYWGDPAIDTLVNLDAMIFVDGDWERDLLPWLRLPEKRVPYRPYFREPSLSNKLCGRSNDLIQWFRERVPYTKGFAAAIDEMLMLERDDNAYMRKLAQPRVKRSVLKIREEYFDFWRAIIGRAIA